MTEIIDQILNFETHFHFSNSSGHGGQNINKRQTKAELYFNIQDSKFLTDDQKQRLIKLGGKKIHHHSSTLIMTCQEQRHQEANKQTVIHHFRQLISKALIQPKQRTLTKTPSQEKEQRLTQKKLNSTKKQNRKINIDIS